MSEDQRGNLGGFADLLRQLGEEGPYVTVEEVGVRRDEPDAGLPVGYKLNGDQQNVALIVTVRPRSDLHRQIRQIAASDVGGRLKVELTPAAARKTAGRLAVRADEVDPDEAGPLAVLADGAHEGIVRGLVHAALPDGMPRHLVQRTADRIASLVVALARATVRRS